MSDMLFCFSCCWSEPVPVRTRKIKIDRSMIGTPENFVHTVHLGSGDMSQAHSHNASIETRMSSKGGYESNGTHSILLDRKVIDVRRTGAEE